MTNLERMIAFADQFFNAKNDPDQIAVDEHTREQLLSIHPATLGEESDENGPVAWVLLVPTTHTLMQKFLSKEIGERSLLFSQNRRYRPYFLSFRPCFVGMWTKESLDFDASAW